MPAVYPPAILILLYGVMPLWLLAGLADWACHRATDLAHTAGPKESWLHLLMFAEVGTALLVGLFLEINAGVILVMICAFLAHEATSLWDVSYAVARRRVSPIEQHVHSFLELLPLVAIVCVISAHWDAFLSLLGMGSAPASFALEKKDPPLPGGYLAVLLVSIAALEVLPYLEELLRARRASRRPLKADLAATALERW